MACRKCPKGSIRKDLNVSYCNTIMPILWVNLIIIKIPFIYDFKCNFTFISNNIWLLILTVFSKGIYYICYYIRIPRVVELPSPKWINRLKFCLIILLIEKLIWILVSSSNVVLKAFLIFKDRDGGRLVPYRISYRFNMI